MGYMRHNAVVVTFSDYILEPLHAKHLGIEPLDVEAFRESMPEEFRNLVVGPIRSVTNGYVSWFFAPDGSKEGWDTSHEGDQWREKFIALFTHAYDDGSSAFDVVEIQYGGDYVRQFGAAVTVDFPGRLEADGS